ncbi:MAG TPA: acVLRF1 family peptidyl-tRNA hydrolase [Candidatus Dormibacteraeota bacterium]|nr:acVLRF1 family peptidyl-tRNA hydrolase [Candidatus Dormibacteraeota bacterium]
MTAAPRPAAGGGRWVDVPPERLQRWLADFDARHRVVRTIATPQAVTMEAADGATAECHPPFPPLTDDLVAHVCRERAVGVLLVRLGGHAVGVFEGDRLIASRVGSRLVHGRHAAGGWSQQRFARRREGQARVAARAAADDAVRVLLPALSRLEAVVLGGDRRAIEPLRADARLAPVFARATDRFLATPEPRLAVLLAAPAQFRAVRIRLAGPA